MAPVDDQPTERTLRCPCGTLLVGRDDDDLVALAQAHLAAEHPGREYTRDEILFLAT
jgi:hypothetical protein